jgi:pyruvate/2-oxoglutarate dehydrogenase complex dihydrolipoamide acyltransferase (E2) component
MAAQSTSKRRSPSSGNGRSASQKPEKYRFAQNLDGEGTIAEQAYRDYAAEARKDPGADPDVLLDVPVLKVDSIHFELDDLDAHVALKAKVLDLVTLNVGVDVHLGKVKLDIKGVEAQALVKVRLDHVAAIVDRVLTTLDRNPELIKSIGKAVEDVGSGAQQTLEGAGEAVEDVGEGAEGAVQDVGEGAGQAVGEVGEGAGQAVGDVGEGAGEAVGDVGEGAGQAAGEIGEGAGQAVGDVGEGAGEVAGNVDQVAGNVGQAAGQVAGGGGGGGSNGGGGGGGTSELVQAAAGGPGELAKGIAKTVAKEIGSAASDEAKDVSMAAARKVQELGERRRQRRAERLNATEAAVRTAGELDVDIEAVEGTGADGRITVRDVRDAQED